jgi:glycosyltransferase involved in cell wall biosynthesis
MNVLILTTHLNSGGITSYLYTLCKGLKKSGHNVYAVSSGGNCVEDFVAVGVKHTEMNIRTKSELHPKIYFALPRLLKLIKDEKIDIIHSHTRVTQVMGFLLGKFAKKPYITTCHGFFKTRLSRRLFRCWGDAAIAISPQVKEHLEKDFCVSAQRVFHVRNGVDVDMFQSLDEETRQFKRREFGFFQEPLIGIIARLSDVKGHHVLIRAMSLIVEKVPEAKLMIVGEGKMEQGLKQQVNSLRLDENIYFYPIVDKTAQFLSLFDVFVMPSLQEGLGLSVMEAPAAGLPVVASRVGGLSSLIENGKTGILVEPDDSRELAAAIIDMLENPKKAKEMGTRAREFIVQECSSDKMVGETVEVYEKHFSF